jgi:hypothetical protein
MPPVEAECIGSPTDAGGGAAEGIRERIHNGSIASLETERMSWDEEGSDGREAG